MPDRYFHFAGSVRANSCRSCNKKYRTKHKNDKHWKKPYEPTPEEELRSGLRIASASLKSNLDKIESRKEIEIFCDWFDELKEYAVNKRNKLPIYNQLRPKLPEMKIIKE